MHALDHRAVLRGHQTGGLRPGNAERVYGVLGVELQPAGGAGGGREHADRRAGVPALADMFLAHALADARTDLVAGERRDQQLAPGEISVALRHREQGRQRDSADMQHTDAMHVVELEALHLGAVDHRGVGRGQRLAGAPDRRRAGGVELPERVLENPAPFQIGAVDGAAERVENKEFQSLPYVSRDLFVADARHELGDLAGMNVVGAGMLCHRFALMRGGANEAEYATSREEAEI